MNLKNKRNLKCQLAVCLDRETEYEKLLKEKDEKIEILSEQLNSIDLSDNLREKESKIDFIVKEKYLNSQLEIDYLKKEILIMASILEQDELKLAKFKE